MRIENIVWGCVGALVGIVPVSRIVIWFFGVCGLMPDDRTPDACGVYIGIPLGAYLGWRLGPAMNRRLGRHGAEAEMGEDDHSPL